MSYQLELEKRIAAFEAAIYEAYGAFPKPLWRRD